MYKSLDYLPWKIFLIISENLDMVYLLSKEDRDSTDFTASEISAFRSAWDKMLSEYEKLTPKSEADRFLKIEREVAYFKAKFKLIHIYCKILRFDWHEEIALELLEFGYTLRDDENYYSDIDRIERESEGLLSKAEDFENQLPKHDLESAGSKTTPDQMLASISAILGFDFDYNFVSVTKVQALLESVSQKVKAMQTTQSTK